MVIVGIERGIIRATWTDDSWNKWTVTKWYTAAGRNGGKCITYIPDSLYCILYTDMVNYINNNVHTLLYSSYIVYIHICQELLTRPRICIGYLYDTCQTSPCTPTFIVIVIRKFLKQLLRRRQLHATYPGDFRRDLCSATPLVTQFFSVIYCTR